MAMNGVRAIGVGGVRKALVGLYVVGKALKEVRTKKSLGPSAEKVVKSLKTSLVI